MFEAIRGTGVTSDIAIDDVKLSAGACPSEGNLISCEEKFFS